MQEYRIGGKVSENLIKVIVNSQDDYIMLNSNDAVFVDKYTGIIKWMQERGASYDKSVGKWEKKYTGRKLVEIKDGVTEIDTEQILELSKLRIDMCRECCERIDGLFGEGTIRKYFREIYEEIPDFVPDEDCVYDFFEEISPIIGDVFNRRIDSVKAKHRKNRKPSHTKSKTELISEYREKKEAEVNE